MKNIHVLPTPNPSRLQLFEGINEFEFELCSKDSFFNKGFHIYITSDEEIKEGDWVYCTERKLFGKVIEIQLAKFKSDTSMLYFEINNEEIWCKLFNCKKIILTTDQDLIKDAIQAIPDEFLEWYVKNPSCGEVEIRKEKVILGEVAGTTYIDFIYKIIIPKECMITKIMQMDAKMAYDSLPKQDKIMERFIANAKQETLEQYLQRLKDRRTEDNYKYTDEDFEKYKDHISDCCKSGMSVYKCLEFMYFAKKDIDDQLFNRKHKQETLEEDCPCTDECLGYLTKTCKRIETLEEYFLGKVKEVLLFKNDAQAIRFMEKYYQAKKEEDERNY